MQVFAYLEGVIVLKLSPIIEVGDSFEHVGALRVINKEGMWVKELDKYDTSVLTMMQMKDFRPSTSPRLEQNKSYPLHHLQHFWRKRRSMRGPWFRAWEPCVFMAGTESCATGAPSFASSAVATACG